MLTNGFFKNQWKEINEGKKHNIDTSIYAKRDYRADQMHQIRLGLENKVDITKFVDNTYSSAQMCQIRIGMIRGYDVSIYARNTINDTFMKRINICISLKNKFVEKLRNIDFSEFTSFQQDEIISGVENDVDISIYADPNFSYLQMREIKKSLMTGVNPLDIINSWDITPGQIREIADGVNEQVNVKIYADLKFNENQMREIKFALKNNIPEDMVKKYADCRFTSTQLELIYYGIKSGFDPSIYARFDLPYAKMEVIVDALINQVDISPYIDSFNTEQLKEIKDGLINGIDVSIYADPKFNSAQMELIRVNMIHNIDVSRFAKVKYSLSQMRQILLGIKKGINVNIYAKACYDSLQMEQIREGIEDGIDVSKYANPSYSWEQMYEIKDAIEQGIDIGRFTFDYTPNRMRKEKKNNE